jgi:hypothetical protein
VAPRGRIYYHNNLVTSGDLVISQSFSKKRQVVLWCGIISDHVAKKLKEGIRMCDFSSYDVALEWED